MESSHHDTRAEAIRAAEAVAERRPGSLVKIHREDNSLETVIPFPKGLEAAH